MPDMILLCSKESMNVVSAWTDELYCSILKDGTLSLRRKAISCDGSGWSPAHRGIKSPQDFLTAFFSIQEWEIDNLSINKDILPKLFPRLPFFSTLTAIYYENEYQNDVIDSELFNILYEYVNTQTIQLPKNLSGAVKKVEPLFHELNDYFQKNESLPNGLYSYKALELDFSRVPRKTQRKLDRYKLELEVRFYINRCSYETLIQGRHAFGRPRDIRREKIVLFLRDFIRKNGQGPKGIQKVEDFEVFFK